MVCRLTRQRELSTTFLDRLAVIGSYIVPPRVLVNKGRTLVSCGSVMGIVSYRALMHANYQHDRVTALLQDKEEPVGGRFPKNLIYLLESDS